MIERVRIPPGISYLQIMESQCDTIGVHCHHRCPKSRSKERLASTFERIKEFTEEVDRSIDERKYPRKEILIFESPVHKRQRKLHNKTVEEVRQSSLILIRP